MKLRCLLAFSLVLILNVSAQKEDTASYYLSYSGSGIYNRTNKGESFVLNNMVKFNVNGPKLAMNSTSRWIYGKQSGLLTNDDYSSVLDFNYLKEIRKLYYWGLASYDKSLSLRLMNRFQGGLGAGYTILDEASFELVISNGFLYERNELSGSHTHEAIRNSSRIKYRIGGDKNIFRMSGMGFYQPSVSDASDHIVKITNTASVRLARWLNFSAGLEYNKISYTQKENLFCNFGFMMETTF